MNYTQGKEHIQNVGRILRVFKPEIISLEDHDNYKSHWNTVQKWYKKSEDKEIQVLKFEN